MELFQAHKILFDTSSTDEAVEDADATCFVVGPASTSTSEWLLANYSTCAFLVVVNVPGSIAQLVRCDDQGFPVCREAVDVV